MDFLIEKTIQKINEYLERVLFLQSQKKLQSQFKKGYYHDSNDRELRELEKHFIKNIPKIRDVLIEKLLTAKNTRQKKILISSLGWAQNYEDVPAILMRYIEDKNIAIANAAMRSLFPMIASGKYLINVNKIKKLAHHSSRYIKNKSLGILAFAPNYPQNDNEKNFKKYVKKLTTHKDPIIHEPAQMLWQKINKIN